MKIVIFLFVILFMGLLLLLWSSPNMKGIYIQSIIAAVALFFGYFSYKFQKETNEFNRLSKIATLDIDRKSLEEEKEIKIVNKKNYPAKNVYIGSFLFSDDGGKNEILYNEIQLQIIQSYPINQADILKSPFRENFESKDKDDYGSTMKARILSFIQDNAIFYLVIALRDHYMKSDETLLFFYKCKNGNVNKLDDLSFSSEHVSANEPLSLG